MSGINQPVDSGNQDDGTYGWFLRPAASLIVRSHEKTQRIRDTSAARLATPRRIPRWLRARRCQPSPHPDPDASSGLVVPASQLVRSKPQHGASTVSLTAINAVYAQRHGG